VIAVFAVLADLLIFAVAIFVPLGSMQSLSLFCMSLGISFIDGWKLAQFMNINDLPDDAIPILFDHFGRWRVKL